MPLRNKKYSFKDFTGQSFVNVDPQEFNNTEIVGSCFYRESSLLDLSVIKNIFPIGMTGVTFSRCNLDNVNVPIGNTVSPNCCSRKIKVQNDREDWVLDGTNKPVEPVAKKLFLQEGKSIDPKDIPITPQMIGL